MGKTNKWDKVFKNICERKFVERKFVEDNL